MKLPPDSFHKRTSVALPFADPYLALVDPKARALLVREINEHFKKPRLYVIIKKPSHLG